MGNICGKESSTDNFSQPGRVLGSAPPPAPKTASVPKKVGGPPRTLGGGRPEASDSSDAGDARKRAAEAAEARANSKGKGGKLQSQLNSQKQQTRTDTLVSASQQEVRARDADEAAKARQWD